MGIKAGFFEPDGAEFEFGLERNGIAFTVGQGVDAGIFFVGLRPMKGHEEAAGPDAVIQFEGGAGKAATGDEADGVAVHEAESPGVGRMGSDEGSGAQFVEFGDMGGFGAGVPLTGETARIEHKREPRRKFVGRR